MIMKNVMIVGLGGMIGSILRYVVYLSLGNAPFPYATMVVNVVGSFIIGAVAAHALKYISFEDWRLFLATGVCGGFTTFSALSFESLQMFQSGRSTMAFSYIISSLTIGILATYVGFMLSK
jgi:CrcB protein